MDELLAQSEYTLALCQGKVTQKLRDNYFSFVTNEN